MTLNSKRKALQFCEEYIRVKQEKVLAEIDKIKEALQSETKSTAGDKHETGRAMLQLEREKLGRQLMEIEKMGNVLKRIELKKTTNQVALGSLVRTDKAIYFVSIPTGQFNLGKESVYCISTVSPIGQLLMGKAVGDTIVFNKSPSHIMELL